jgi:hypothetical protein
VISQWPASPMVDHVIGAFRREILSAALAAIHRAGFGPHTRVLDGARADAAQQLARTGLYLCEEQRPPADAILIVITAPGRTAVVADLFMQMGAASIAFASRIPVPTPASAAADPIVPDVRIGDDATIVADA